MNIRVAVDFSGIPRSTLYLMIASGEIVTAKVGNKRLVSKRSLIEFLERHARTGAELSTKDTRSKETLLSREIDTIGLSTRSLNSLSKAGFKTVAELIQETEHTLIVKVWNLGRTSLHDVRQCLARLGFMLARDTKEKLAELGIFVKGDPE